MKSKFLVGAARVDITPDDAWYPLRRGLRADDNRLPDSLKSGVLGGTLDRLYARAVAVRNAERTVLLLSLDYIGVPDGEAKARALSEALNIPEENIFLLATHTHNVPTLGGPGGLENNPDFRRLAAEEPETARHQLLFKARLEEGVFAAARAALSALRPARMGIGYADSYINVNRDQKYNGEYHMGYNGAGHSDKTAALIRFEDEAGHTIARFANYACHAISAYLNRCLPGGVGGVTADIPGFVSRAFETLDPGSVCIWSAGAQGNQNPLFMNFVSTPDPGTGEVCENLLDPGSYQVTEVLGARHFADLRAAERGISAYADTIALRALREVQQLPVDTSRPPSRWHRVTKDGCHQLITSCLMLGDVLLYGIGGELYSDVGCKLKRLSSMKHTLIVCLCLGSAGYLMDDDDLTAPTLFARRTLWKPGTIVPALEGFLKKFTGQA